MGNKSSNCCQLVDKSFPFTMRKGRGSSSKTDLVATQHWTIEPLRCPIKLKGMCYVDAPQCDLYLFVVHYIYLSEFPVDFPFPLHPPATLSLSLSLLYVVMNEILTFFLLFLLIHPSGWIAEDGRLARVPSELGRPGLAWLDPLRNSYPSVCSLSSVLFWTDVTSQLTESSLNDLVFLPSPSTFCVSSSLCLAGWLVHDDDAGSCQVFSSSSSIRYYYMEQSRSSSSLPPSTMRGSTTSASTFAPHCWMTRKTKTYEWIRGGGCGKERRTMLVNRHNKMK